MIAFKRESVAELTYLSVNFGPLVDRNDPAAMRARWTAAGVEHAVTFQPAGVRGVISR